MRGERGKQRGGDEFAGANGPEDEPGSSWPAGVDRSGTRLRAAPGTSPVVFEPCVSLTVFYRRYRTTLWRLARCHVWDDAATDEIVQRVFVTLVRKNRGDGPMSEDLVKQVHAILRGEIQNHVRVSARHRADGEADADAAPSSWPEPEEPVRGFVRG